MTRHGGWRGKPRPVEADGLVAALTAEGLGAGRGSWTEDPVELARRLRQALARLGPVPRAFGRHLATRADILPGAACRELAGFSDASAPLPPGAVAAMVEAELGRPLGEAFSELAPEPFVAGAFRQIHRARTLLGEEVEVVVAPAAALAAADPRELEPVARVLDRAGLPAEELLADFRRFAVAAGNLEEEAEILTDLAAAAALDLLVVPAVHRALSRGRVLVQAALSGATPDRLAARDPAERAEALRRLALAWLHQVVFGAAFPLSPAGPGTRLLADGRVAFASGPFGVLPAASRANLWSHLESGVVDDPAMACERLLPEMVREADAVSEPELMVRLRQVVAFRDGSLGEGADSLADHHLAILRVARTSGYRLRRPAAGFARSLAGFTGWAADVAPGAEPLRGALEELRLRRSAGDLRGAFDPAGWMGLSGPHATLLLELPRKLDAALDLLSRGEATVRLQVEAPAGRRGGGGIPALALGVVAGVLVLVAPRLGELTSGASGTGLLALMAAALVASLAWRR